MASTSTAEILIAFPFAAGIPTASGADAAPASEYGSGIRIDHILTAKTTATGQPIRYPATAHPEIQMLRATLYPGQETGVHLHPVPGFIYVLSGVLTVVTEYSARDFYAGEGFAESIATFHNGENRGNVPVELLILFLGIDGESSTITPCCAVK